MNEANPKDPNLLKPDAKKTYDQGLNCNVIHDLLPSYIDGICSEDSKEIIENHISSCADCAELIKALRDSEIMEGNREIKQIAYMKKIKKHAGKKEFFGLGILIATIIIGSRIFMQHYGAVPLWLYLTLMPLILFDAHFVLADHITENRHTTQKTFLILASILLLCFGISLAFISMHWIKRGNYPFGIKASELGGFLNAVYLALALCQLAIFTAASALTFKTSNTHSLAVSISIIGLFLIFYTLSIFAILSTVEMSTKSIVKSAYLLLEGGCITAATEFVWAKRLRKKD